MPEDTSDSQRFFAPSPLTLGVADRLPELPFAYELVLTVTPQTMVDPVDKTKKPPSRTPFLAPV